MDLDQIKAQIRTSPGRVMALQEIVKQGVDRRMVAAWVARGDLRRVERGVLRVAEDPIPPIQSVVVPQVYLDQRRPAEHLPCVASGRAGLAARGLGPFTLPCEPLLLIDQRCRARPGRDGFTTRRTELRGLEWDVVSGARVALVGRCVADAGLEHDVADRDLRVAVDDIRNRRLADTGDLVREWAGIRHAGARRMSALASAGAFEQESEGERAAFRALFEPLGRLPDCQVVLLGPIRVDFVFLSAALVIEYFGVEAHRDRMEYDMTRIRALEALGYRVIVVTRSMLRDALRLAAHIDALRVDREQRIASGALRRPDLPPQPERLTPLRTLYPLG